MNATQGIPASVVEDALAQFDAWINNELGMVGSGPFSDALDRALSSQGYTIVKDEELEAAVEEYERVARERDEAQMEYSDALAELERLRAVEKAAQAVETLCNCGPDIASDHEDACIQSEPEMRALRSALGKTTP